MPEVIELDHTSHRLLNPSSPFHFDGTVYKPSYFPGPELIYEPGRLWHSLRFEDLLFVVRLENLGTIETPSLCLSIFSREPLSDDLVDRIADEIAWRYDLDSDLSTFYDGYRSDPLLAPVLGRWRGVRPSTYSSLYEYLVIATLLQNATVRRTVQMAENLFAHYGTQLVCEGRTLSAFWTPEAIRQTGEEELRALKLGYRAKTLKRQAACFGPGGLDEGVLRTLPTPVLKKALLQIYGVGPASVWYLLFGQFKRYEAFEYVSPWEQKIYSRLLFDRDLVEPVLILAEVEQRWGRWKMLAAHLLFEDLFWQHRRETIPWLDELIRL